MTLFGDVCAFNLVKSHGTGMFCCQAGTCLNCTIATLSSLFPGRMKWKTAMLSSLPCNAVVMSCHRSCGWFPSDSRGTVTVMLSVVLTGAGMSWGKCLHLTLSPLCRDLVKVATDYLKEERYRKKSVIAVLVLTEDLGG